MRGNADVIVTSLLGLLVLSLLLLPSAQATQWVGNDDGEFDTSSLPTYVFVQESFSIGMAWSSSTLPNQVSLQYNPDRYRSYWWQAYMDWFQAVIASTPNGCALFTIQVYSLLTGDLDWSQFYPNGGNPPGITVNQILANNAIWYIEEDMSGNYINHVYFGLTGYASSMSYTIYPPQNWVWLRSNICWCGGPNGGYDTFTSAGGTSYVGSNGYPIAIPPPTDIATSENSNMPYGQFQGSGTLGMTQSFGWPPPPPPPCSGCHCYGSSISTSVPVDPATKGNPRPFC